MCSLYFKVQDKDKERGALLILASIFTTALFQKMAVKESLPSKQIRVLGSVHLIFPLGMAPVCKGELTPSDQLGKQIQK